MKLYFLPAESAQSNSSNHANSLDPSNTHNHHHHQHHSHHHNHHHHHPGGGSHLSTATVGATLSDNDLVDDSEELSDTESEDEWGDGTQVTRV